jgi:drug/metabolite transporter (DMT)-like permease
MTLNPPKAGLLFALAGFAMLSIGDAVIKTIAGQAPSTLVTTIRYCVGVIGLAAILYHREGRAGFRVPMPRMQLLRGVSIAVSALCFFSAIYLMPLAEATAITFTGPILTALFSAWFLKERAGPATWIAAAIAFLGVLLILRPNVAALGVAALLPLVSAIAMAGLILGNRAVAGAGSVWQMQFLLSVVAAVFLIVVSAIGHFSGIAALAITVPSWSVLLRCAFVAVTASTAHWLLYLATTKTNAANVAPMSYVQLLVAILLGIIGFGDWPDGFAIIGSVLIVTAGVYLWRSKR